MFLILSVQRHASARCPVKVSPRKECWPWQRSHHFCFLINGLVDFEKFGPDKKLVWTCEKCSTRIHTERERESTSGCKRTKDGVVAKSELVLVSAVDSSESMSSCCSLISIARPFHVDL